MENIPNGASFSGLYFDVGKRGSLVMVYATYPGGSGTGGIFTGYLPGGIDENSDAETHQNIGINYQIILRSSSVTLTSNRIKCVPKYTIDKGSPGLELVYGETCVFVQIIEVTQTANLIHPAILVCTYSEYPKVKYSGITMDGRYTVYYEVTQSGGPPRASLTMTLINENATETEIDTIFE